MLNQVIQGDCLEVMTTLPSHSIDLIATDLPYGTTACSWDFIIDPVQMWQQIKRILKSNGAFITTSSQPFTTAFINSNLEWFKYELIWEKEQGTNFFNIKHQPYKAHENILVFSPVAASYSTKGSMVYNPQMVEGEPYKARNENSGRMVFHSSPKGRKIDNKGWRYPKSILRFNRDKGLHPTQKPVALFEYLIKTYSNPGDLVLDCTAGSGTTGVAALNTNRNFILIEKEQKYIDIIYERLAQVQQQPRFDEMAC